MLRVLIVDDEPLALRILENKLESFPEVHIVGTTTKFSDVLPLVERTKPDVVFLDINLGTVSGLDIAEIIYTRYDHIQIVFVTAYSKFAIEAFELNAIDYLLKPVSTSRLKKTLARLENRRTVPKIHTTLYLEVFRTGNLFCPDGVPFTFRTKKVAELFFFLWHQDQKRATRDEILAQLWPTLDEERGATLMHSTIYQLRKTLQQKGFKKPIPLENQKYRLNVPLTSDLEKWEACLEKPPTDETVQEALSLYRGHYFEMEAFSWAHFRMEQIKMKWSHYLFSLLEKPLHPQTMERIILWGRHNERLDEKWGIALIDYFGKREQTHQLVTYYELVKKAWSDELGLDVPQAITDRYNAFLFPTIS